MKYANIVFDGNRKGSVNIGDDLQLIAIQNLYEIMGIPQNDIVRIGLSELSDYDGEYVILPVSFPLYGYRKNTYITMFSPKIIPVFLGLSIMSDNISDEESIYLRRFEPIGCRDYHTVNILRKHNILAYLNGCITLTLPTRCNLKGTKPYLVDIPQRYLEYIPQKIRNKAVCTSQVLTECNDPEATMRERLDEYAQNASMVVTTRLHCALPCIAMGIPVIFMKDHYSFRFPTLSRYIHVYTDKEFGDIDWTPKPVDYEASKKKLIDLDIKRITDAYNKYSDIFDVSYYYEDGNLQEKYYIEHYDNVIEEILPILNEKDDIRYAIWGITQKADMICTFIENRCPKAKLVIAHDRSKKCLFHGIESTDDMEKLVKDVDYVFVTAATANDIARSFFTSRNFNNYNISDDGIGT